MISHHTVRRRRNIDGCLNDGSRQEGGSDVVVYLPQIHFTNSPEVSLDSGEYEINADVQELIWKGVTFESRKSKNNNVRKLVILNDSIIPNY